jgi:hypothetical protein
MRNSDILISQAGLAKKMRLSGFLSPTAMFLYKSVHEHKGCGIGFIEEHLKFTVSSIDSLKKEIKNKFFNCQTGLLNKDPVY